jgi:hypothetical protein
LPACRAADTFAVSKTNYMKKPLLSLTFLFGALTLAAQPVLQQGSLAAPGLVATINAGPSVSPGAAGANQTWNFSSATTTPVGTYSIVSCGSTSCSGSFPTANWCFAAGPEYTYMMATATTLEMIGSGIPFNCSGGEVFSNSKTVITFPLSYQGTVNDAWVSNQGAANFSATYDGYGTLITPFGTHTNVVRMSVIDDGGASTIWLNTNPIYQLMNIDASGNTIIMSNATFSIAEHKSALAVSVFPNPAKGEVTVQIENPQGESTIEVIDLLGNVLISRQAEGPDTTLDISQLSAGLYLVRSTNGLAQNITKLMVE